MLAKGSYKLLVLVVALFMGATILLPKKINAEANAMQLSAVQEGNNYYMYMSIYGTSTFIQGMSGGYYIDFIENLQKMPLSIAISTTSYTETIQFFVPFITVHYSHPAPTVYSELVLFEDTTIPISESLYNAITQTTEKVYFQFYWDFGSWQLYCTRTLGGSANTYCGSNNRGDLALCDFYFELSAVLVEEDIPDAYYYFNLQETTLYALNLDLDSLDDTILLTLDISNLYAFAGDYYLEISFFAQIIVEQLEADLYKLVIKEIKIPLNNTQFQLLENQGSITNFSAEGSIAEATLYKDLECKHNNFAIFGKAYSSIAPIEFLDSHDIILSADYAPPKNLDEALADFLRGVIADLQQAFSEPLTLDNIMLYIKSALYLFGLCVCVLLFANLAKFVATIFR